MKTITFKSSGNIGDSIYSLSFVKKVWEQNQDARIEYYFHLNQKSTFDDKSHPVGSVMLNEKMYELALPLFEATSFIDKVDIYEGQDIDYDLDLFRKENKNLSAGDIKLWHCVSYPEVRPDVTDCIWPNLEPIENDWILLNRTLRYNAPHIDYTVLPSNTKFIGVESEYKIIKAIRPDIEHLQIKDYYELARYIKGCKLFIGNQSSPFAIAEQLKTPRVLEQFFGCPNVIPQGGQWNIFHTNKQFEQILKQLNIL